jgi:protein-L-isoaspartate(D-aspartate) O-methyltransferase
MKRQDTYRHKGMRKKLAEEVHAQGINDERILAAIENIPRHLFLDEAFVEMAYKNQAFPIGRGQTISQPYTVAFQTELLDLKKGEKVLEIGTGSGYQACVLAELGAKVFSIERHESLSEKAKNIITELGYNVRCIYGDGFLGFPALAPFDKIIITAAAPEIPPKLIEQLKVGGIMVIPKDEEDQQIMLKITKLEDGSLNIDRKKYFKFVPMLKGKT